MADVTGPLQAAAKGADVPQVAPQKTQTEDAFSNILRSSMEKAQQTQRALDIRKNELLNLSQQRMFNPTLMKFAGAMLSPTKTGSFGESLGYGAAAAAEEQEKEFLRQQAFSKLQYEMEVESAKQKQAAMLPQLLMSMQQEGANGAPAAVPAAASVPSAAGTPTAPVVSAPAVSKPRTLFQNTPGDKLALGMAVPEMKPFIEAELALRKENREQLESERKAYREVDFGPLWGKRLMHENDLATMNKLRENGDIPALKKFLNKYDITLELVEDVDENGNKFMRSASPSEIEQRKELAKQSGSLETKDYPIPEIGKDKYPLLPKDFASLREARKAGPDALQKWFNENAPEYGVKIKGASVSPRISGVVTEEGRPEGASESKVREAGQIEGAKERAKTLAEKKSEFIARGTNADDLVMPAKEILALANDPVLSKSMGILEKPKLASVIAKGFADKAPFEVIRHGAMALMTDDKGRLLPEEERKAILDGARKYYENGTRIELMYTRTYTAKQGSVTENERKLVRETGFDKADSPNVVRAKAKALIARGEFDQKAAETFIDWEKKNPNGTIEEFQLKSPEYKELKSQLNSEIGKIYNEHFGSRGGSAARNSASSQPQRNTVDGVDQSTVNRFVPRR
jgi:hypothetical protein